MPDRQVERAVQLLDELERNREMSAVDVEHAVYGVLTAAGYAVSTPSPGRPDIGIDMEFQGRINGEPERVGVEVKSHRGKVSGQTIYKAMDAMRATGLDRILIVALGGYSNLALERAGIERLGKVDLLDIPDLRSWLQRHETFDEPETKSVRQILRHAMRELALRLAVEPTEIYDVEWRDMERLLGEVFQRLGFTTHVTPSAKDGGIDVHLVDPEGRAFIVEVKHWLSKVGTGAVKRLVEVTARKGARSGLLLATGGFADVIFDGLIEVKAPVRLGDANKIVSLCQAFYRAETQLWQPDNSLEDLLLAETLALSDPPIVPTI
ncbi:restriction endonuclease [Brevundimonas naejangsanensis]|uniref:Restriction endonuclease n=1 Tax=Brevundimonas naejangsanensis TaxID=588932 RepID=A0A494RL10_9CAUL|nr:restriction endonuclease [Brevundimonas naejangsanensis]AYG95613.1 restriction endonuclease [Brevundimonas naejangsanensis]